MQVLQDLWITYLTGGDKTQSAEERGILSLLMEDDEKLRADLSQEQIALLEKCESHWDDLQELTAREAFFKGIRLGAGFMREALLS